MNILGIEKRKILLNYNPNLIYNAKVVSYGGYLDIIVPYKWTKYSDEEHHNILATHFYFLFSRKIIRKIIESHLV